MKVRRRSKKNNPILLILLFLTTFLTMKIFKKVEINNIKIYGSELFSKEDLVANSSLNLPTKLIFVKTRYVETELKKNLFLEDVSVRREILPFGLKIRIQTRTPVALGVTIIQGKNIKGFVDEEGYFIKKNYTDKNLSEFPCKVLGWKEEYRKQLSKILSYQKNNDIQFITINFSPNGFLTLEEKSLKKLLLGFNPNIIETQLKIISELKNQPKVIGLYEKIDNIDLTDPRNPRIKVFKP